MVVRVQPRDTDFRILSSSELFFVMKKFHLSIVVTNQCNLRCSYCYEQSKTAKRIRIDKAKSIVAQYLNSPEYDEVEIDFFGGEPFLEFQTIKEVCEWVWSQDWKNKYIFFATSNGTLIHGEISEWLREHKDRFWVSLSLDGTKESHDKNRCSSFDRIDLDFFRECWPRQTVKMTISKETAPELYRDITYIHSLGFPITGTNFAEGLDWKDENLVQTVFKQLELLAEFYIKNPQYEVVPLLNMAIYKCEAKERNKWCGCGETMAAFDTDGKIYPCTFFTPMTFSKEQLKALEGINYSDAELFIDNECFDNCYLSPVCNCCYGANYLTTGKINSRDRSKCELIKIRAVFSAAIKAQRIIEKPDDTYENALTIRAISRINELYNH